MGQYDRPAVLILKEKSFIHTYPFIHLHPIARKRAGYNDRVGEDGLQLLLRFASVRFPGKITQAVQRERKRGGGVLDFVRGQSRRPLAISSKGSTLSASSSGIRCLMKNPMKVEPGQAEECIQGIEILEVQAPAMPS